MTPYAKTSDYRVRFDDVHGICIVYLRGAVPDANTLTQFISLLSSDDEDEEPASAEPEFHHLNFMGNPVYHKSSTPAEVSLWLVCTAHEKPGFHPFSRQGVITSQAMKLIDPFMYSGSEDLLQTPGGKLRDVVTGLVHKAYNGQGTWRSDRYDWDEAQPINFEFEYGTVYKCTDDSDDYGSLQKPHWMSRDDCEDTILNDGKGCFPPKPFRSNPDETFKPTPSKLCVVESADYGSLEAEPVMPCLQSAEKAIPEVASPEEASAVADFELGDDEVEVISGQVDEDIEAVSDNSYGSQSSAFSYEEDTTDYTSTWYTWPKPAEDPSAAYLAQWSEDKPSLIVEIDSADSLAQWLDASAGLHEPEVASVPAEDQQPTSSGNELDQQVEDDVSASDLAAECFSPVSDSTLSSMTSLSVNDGRESLAKAVEETEDSSPSTSPLSTSSISASSSKSSESMAERDQKDDDVSPKLDGTYSKLALKEIVSSPAEESNPDYPELFVACDHAYKLIAAAEEEEVVVWRKDVSAGLRALKPFVNPIFDFRATCAEDEDDANENSQEGIYALSPISYEAATNLDRNPRRRPGRDPIQARIQRVALRAHRDCSGP